MRAKEEKLAAMHRVTMPKLVAEIRNTQRLRNVPERDWHPEWHEDKSTAKGPPECDLYAEKKAMEAEAMKAMKKPAATKHFKLLKKPAAKKAANKQKK